MPNTAESTVKHVRHEDSMKSRKSHNLVVNLAVGSHLLALAYH